MVRVSVFMRFVYLDEFGHIGPYVSRSSKKHNESPVFGLAGIILPEDAVRPFATFFLQQKERAFAFELEGSGKMAAKWEKKGTSFIRPGPLKKYPNVRQLLNRTINQLLKRGGNIFYYGREKEFNKFDGNATGLYTTCLAHALRRLDTVCGERDDNFVVVIDQHSARKELLECAAKTMFGYQPCRRLASPPFEVESYLNQNIQAADWIATLVGRLMSYAVCPNEFPDFGYIDKIFGERVARTSINSQLMRRPQKREASGHSTKEIDENHPFYALQQLKEQM